MKKLNAYVIIILLTVLIIPSVAFASWWNPFSWHWYNIFNIFSKPQTSVVQPVQPRQNINQNQTQNSTSNQTNVKLVINSVSGPTTLIVGQTGTWTINASDSASNNLTYGAIWGDEGIGCVSDCDNLTKSFAKSQSPTISHSYQGSLVGTVIFVVKDDKGNFATKSVSLIIKPSATSSINITSPVGGENWHIGETHNITWTSTDVKNVYIYLVYYSNSNKQNFSAEEPIATIPAPQGTYSWTIQNQMYANGASILNPAGQTFKILINEAGTSTKATSDFFNINQ